MIIAATIEDIARRCEESFNDSLSLDEIYEYIKKELKDDAVTAGTDFESFHSAFINTVTINKEAFIESEKDSVRTLLGQGLDAWQSGRHGAYNKLRRLILINKSEFEIFTYFYFKHRNSFPKLVSIVFCYGLVRYELFLTSKDISEQTESHITNSSRLKTTLTEYGFYNLPPVTKLSAEGQDKLVEIVSSNGLPYAIAMFDYLGFLLHLEKEYFPVKHKRNKAISEWFDSGKGERAVKGNISVLQQYSKEDKVRYTAWIHKETVKKDYQGIK